MNQPTVANFPRMAVFFFTASQDYKVRLYNTAQNFPWRVYKTVRAEMARWTVTDVTLSRNNEWIAYSSITPVVHLSGTSPEAVGQEALDFSLGRRSRAMSRSRGIWSIRFSADGREIVAGANDSCMYVYDIETKTVLFKLEGHKDDVNAVCFGDDSGNLIFSGSDDHMIKVWDRRSMRNEQESGVLVGHVEGITYIDSKRDGRYLLSNGKDQSMKLWDIRKMVTPDRYSQMDQRDYSSHFDYRYQAFPGPIGGRHPNDCSVMTYLGHRVLRTLIRCHFSPLSSSGSQYLYSGSSDGKVHIWNLDGSVAKIIDVSASMTRAKDLSDEYDGTHSRGMRYSDDSFACVRDASWHPYLPVIATAAWSGYSNQKGSIMLHQWRDLADGDVSVESESGRAVPSIHSGDTDDLSDEDYDDQDDYF